MKKAMYITCSLLLMSVIISGNEHQDKKNEKFIEPYQKLLIYSRKLPPSEKKLIDSFIKIDQQTTLRTSYYLRMVGKN